MKLHITITDNETGKVLHETDANAIIGGCKTDEGSQGICIASCSDFDLSMTINSAEEVIHNIKKQKGPAFAIATEMFPALIKKVKDETIEEDANE